MHRDVKLSNFTVTPLGEIRLADFGSARALECHNSELTPAALRTTLLYRAPECLLGCPAYTTAVDMWGIGVTFAELLLRRHLFNALGELQVIAQIFTLLGTPSKSSWPAFFDLPVCQSFQFTEMPSKLRETLASATPQPAASLVDLIGGLLCVNPAARLSATDALHHPYFTDSATDYEAAAAVWKSFVQTAIQARCERGNHKGHRAVQHLWLGGDEGDDDDDD
jgi:serine/threonine protein kinase